MTNWKKCGNPFLDFTEEITYEWMKNGFSRNECKEWLDIGMKAEDAGFCAWLGNEAQINPLEVLNYNWEEDLRKQYREFLKYYSMDAELSAETINQLRELKNLYKYEMTEQTDYKLLNQTLKKEQSLINKLIPNQELRKRYEKYGLCSECNQPTVGENWCKFCNSKHFQQEFKNWTSDNEEIDEFIQKRQLRTTKRQEVLEWIPYEKFYNIEYLAEGGFGIVYGAFWTNGSIERWNFEDNDWKRSPKFVVLKSLHNSQNMTTDFLQEITFHKLVDNISNYGYGQIVPCYGVSQDPKTGNYLMVMKHIEGGNLRKYLNNNYKELDFSNKFYRLRLLIHGLLNIHDQGLVHKDFHSGNILNNKHYSYITDLGLCQPVDKKNKKGKIFGVLPYVAPEVLRGSLYTQASDVYSFGIVAYEVLSGLPPYYDIPHDDFLAHKICQGLRPKLPNNVELPQLLKDTVIKCWDANPNNRPTVSELKKTLDDWYDRFCYKNDEFFNSQYKEIEAKFNQILSIISNNETSLTYQIHPSAIYTSRLLDYKNLPEPQNSKEINEQFYNSKEYKSLQINFLDENNSSSITENSNSIQLDLTKLNLEEINEEELQSRQEIPPK